MKTYALILAAGKGTRMKIDVAKCAFPILNKPIVEYVVERFEKTNLVDEILLIVGYKKELFYELLKDRVKFFEQKEQKGTADAVRSAAPYLQDKEGTTIIVPGDVPLMETSLTEEIIKLHKSLNNDLTVCTMKAENPYGYGRILRDKDGRILKIVEHKDCTDEQKETNEVNTGIYVVDNKYLFEKLTKIDKNNNNHEFYLTDIVELMNKKHQVGSFLIEDYWQTVGINNLYQASEVENYLIKKINEKHSLNGVSLISSNNIVIGHDVVIEAGVTIYPNTIIAGKTTIKKDSVIGPNTTLKNAIVNENVKIEHSVVSDSTIDDNAYVGPFSHIRDFSYIGKNTRIGNYTEIKNSAIGEDCFAAHHAYIGDSKVGNRVNFGSGSVTANFDGINKYLTTIGDDVFIGCNVNLIAPIRIENETIIAAGSTVSEDVKTKSLVITRSPLVNKENYYDKYFKKDK